MNIALIGNLRQCFVDRGLTGKCGWRPSVLPSPADLDRAPMLRRHGGDPGWTGPPGLDRCPAVRIEDACRRVRRSGAFADEDEFLAWSARRSTIPLDRARRSADGRGPGLPGGRIGVVIAVHHVAADGSRGAEIIGGFVFDQAADEIVAPTAIPAGAAADSPPSWLAGQRAEPDSGAGRFRAGCD